MRTLHIINQPNIHWDLVSDQDAILLMENGVYYRGDISRVCYALSSDLAARGLKHPDNVNVIGYPEFVELCTEYDKVVTW